MLGCQVEAEALRRLFYKTLPQFKELKGNALWAWEHRDWQKDNPDKPYDLGMISYASEGVLKPLFVRNIDDEVVQEYTKKWVIHPTAPVVPESDSKKPKYDEWQHICDDFFKDDWRNMQINLSLIRSWTMRWYWKRDGRLPNAGCYKRNAASLFLRLAEEREMLDPLGTKPFSVALEEIKDLWY